MYLSLNWLKDFVDIPKNINPEELGRLFTMHTVEIDGITKQADKFANVVVGQIKEVKPHPNADRLRLAKVEVAGKTILDIVCGAPNIEAGQLVPVALVGAVLPSGAEIKESEIRGEKSCGMLCAEDELGLGNDHAGIMILEKSAKIGQNLSDYLKLKDVIFEVDNKSITHRADLWSHVGMARELAVFLDTTTTKEFKRLQNNEIKAPKTGKKINVKITANDLCFRYLAAAMEGIKIEDSPAWMQERLIAVGMRPVNNIVDITNYVMMEMGQPLHAFDARLIDKIVIRRAAKNEIIKTLDGEKRKLDEQALVIANGQKALAIAGIMGGEDSEVKADTTSIVFEAANFYFASVRKTSARLGLRTESSIRFEKALDPNLAEQALARAVELTQKLCPGARVISPVAEQKNFVSSRNPIELNLNWLEGFIGQKLEEKKIITILNGLGFEVKKNKDNFSVIAPTWRSLKDVTIKEDLAEEIARIVGYDNLKPHMPAVEIKKVEINEERALEREIKNILSLGAKMTESYNYSFVGEEILEKMGVNHSQYIRLANPIASQHTLLRQTLATNLLTNIKTNQARFEEIKMFEVGSVYLSHGGELARGGKSEDRLPYQERRVGLLFAGQKPGEIFSFAKGVVEYLLGSFNLDVSFAPIESAPDWTEKNESAQIIVGRKLLGTVYKLNKQTKNKLGIKKDAVIAEISLKELHKVKTEQPLKKFREFEKYPPVIRDLAFVVSEKKIYTDIAAEISRFHDYIKQVELFDVYQGEKIGTNNKSLAFRLIYQADKTLTAEEVDAIQKNLVKDLEDKFEAKVRDF